MFGSRTVGRGRTVLAVGLASIFASIPGSAGMARSLDPSKSQTSLACPIPQSSTLLSSSTGMKYGSRVLRGKRAGVLRKSSTSGYDDTAENTLIQGIDDMGMYGVAKNVDTPGNPAEESETEPAFYSPTAEDWPMDYFGESTRGDLLPRQQLVETGRELSPDDINGMQEELGLDHWGTPMSWELPTEPQRSVFCSRTLNMRSLRCIGYDMDYTLIHYKVVEWEGRAYYYAKQNLMQVGFPVDDVKFNPDLVCRGLIIDKALGNMVKVDRFGYVRRAMHGTRRLSHRETHEVYGRELVDLREKRWLFLNTLFSVSEGCLYAQLVEKFDTGLLEDLQSRMSVTYESLFNAVSKALFKAHVEGRLKSDVMKNPYRYVEDDADLPKTLMDQKQAGKKLALITNSDWEYTKVMMTHVIDRFLPEGSTWRDLFDVTIVSARKPAFFSQAMPLYEIVTEDGMMREKFRMKEGRLYSGGSASMVEALFKCGADDIMYIGDHIFTDVNLAKAYMRWRTALIVREIEEEVVAMDTGRHHTLELHALIKAKEKCGNILNHMRTELHRYERDGKSVIFSPETEGEMRVRMGDLLATMVQYDNKIAPMMYQEGSDFNKYWGYISRGGFGDKSHLMRQIEKYADVYTSRVSNFLRYTPYMYFRASRQSLAHHRNLDKYRQEVPQGLLQARVNAQEEALAAQFLEQQEEVGPASKRLGTIVSFETTEFGHSIPSSGISELDDHANDSALSGGESEDDDGEEWDDDVPLIPVQPR